MLRAPRPRRAPTVQVRHLDADPADAAPPVESADLVGPHRLRLRFADGTERAVDFEPFLRARAGHPALAPYLDPATFARFRIEQGSVIWGDYDLLFAPATLYRGTL